MWRITAYLLWNYRSNTLYVFLLNYSTSFERRRPWRWRQSGAGLEGYYIWTSLPVWQRRVFYFWRQPRSNCHDDHVYSLLIYYLRSYMSFSTEVKGWKLKKWGSGLCHTIPRVKEKSWIDRFLVQQRPFCPQCATDASFPAFSWTSILQPLYVPMSRIRFLHIKRCCHQSNSFHTWC